MSSATPPEERATDCAAADAYFVAHSDSSELFKAWCSVPAAPGLVVEMWSPLAPWSGALSVMLNHLRTSASVVVLLDARTQSASVFRDHRRPEIFEADQNLVLPDVLPGFAVPVAALFA